MYEYTMLPVRVIDGDTVVVDIDLGLCVRKTETLRLAGINTPEMNSSDPELRARASQAKTFLHSALFGAPGRRFIVRTAKPYETDKYGRWLGTIVATDIDGSKHVLNEEIVAQGLAQVYAGGVR